jgi:hypothetical protein
MGFSGANFLFMVIAVLVVGESDGRPEPSARVSRIATNCHSMALIPHVAHRKLLLLGVVEH